MYPYPDNVGSIIPAILHQADFNFQNKEFKNTIITFYGLPSTGKGTISRIVAAKLGLPLFETGVMYRIFTFSALKNPDKSIAEQILIFKENLTLDLVDSKIVISISGIVPKASEIRNPDIDLKMGDYTKIPEVRSVIDELIASFVLKSSFVTDGRGAFDGYLLQAEKIGVKVIRVLLQSEQKERIRRRFIDYLALERGNEIDSEYVEKLWKKCQEVVIHRDEEEILKDKMLNLGLISDDSGILDTTSLEIDQAVNSVLGWIDTQI